MCLYFLCQNVDVGDEDDDDLFESNGLPFLCKLCVVVIVAAAAVVVVVIVLVGVVVVVK